MRLESICDEFKELAWVAEWVSHTAILEGVLPKQTEMDSCFICDDK